MGQWLFAIGRVGRVTEVEETGVIVLAASLLVDGSSVVRKRETREFLTITESIRLRYTLHRPAHTRRHGRARTVGCGFD